MLLSLDKGVAIFLWFGALACSSRPIEDISLADTALKAAQKARAEFLAPDFFRKAENYYLRAKKDYSEGYFDSCRKFANEARLAAEQAEYRSLLKQFQMRDKGTVEDPGYLAPERKE